MTVTIQQRGAFTREVLQAARTYYVRTDGSDSNNGLANTSGGAFLTIGKALTVCGGLDLGVYNATIQVGSGTFSADLTVSSPWTGSGSVLLYGDNTTPSNCVIGTVTVNTGARLKIRGFRTPLISAAGGFINIVGKMDYTSGQTFQLAASVGGIINSEFITYNISAASTYAHALANSGGMVLLNSCTVTTTGTLNFTGYFSFATRGGIIDQSSSDFSGVSLTGTGKYVIDTGGIIYTGGGTLPGSGTSGGTTSGGGFYV